VVTSGGNNYILGSNSDNSALEFKAPADVLSQIGAQSTLTGGTDYLRPTTDVDDTPVNGETAQPASSNSVYDHIFQLGNLHSFLKTTGLTAEPTGQAVGDIVHCAVASWDPCSIGGATNYLAICTETGTPNTYRALVKDDGTLLLVSIEVPTLKFAELNDTSSQHVLTAAELKGTILSNIGADATHDYIFPALSEGWNFVYAKEADQTVTIHPASGEHLHFRNNNDGYLEMDADEHLVNSTNGLSTLTVFSTENGIYCTGDDHWAQETP
jgi:hypothetical protein